MDYDEIVHSKDIQMLKSILPIMDRPQQMTLAILIQTMEFKNTLQLFRQKESPLSACDIHNESARMQILIQALQKNLPPEEQESIQNMINMFQMMSMMNNENIMENFENL